MPCAAPQNNRTFAVVWEVEQKGLEAAGVGSELIPDDFTEQDHGDVVLHLEGTRERTLADDFVHLC